MRRTSKKDNDQDRIDDEKESEDLQLDNWIKNIGQQWPLRPEPSTKAQQPSAPDESENPLAALLNLEALLSLTRLQPESKKSIDNLIDGIYSALKDSSPQISQWNQWIRFGNENEASADKTKELPPQGDATIITPAAAVKPLPSSAANATTATGSPTDNARFLKQATVQLESLLSDASALVSPANIQGLIAQASNFVAMGSNATVTGVSDLAKMTKQELRDATNLAASIVSVADALRLGPNDAFSSKTNDQSVPIGASANTTRRASSSRAHALFDDFESATELPAYSPTIAKAAELGALAGVIYENGVEMVHSLNHSIVAKGLTEHVRWMVTDSVMTMDAFRENSQKMINENVFVRTITIRGFDASDNEVDRELLLNNICSAAPESIKELKEVVFHSGLLNIARCIYDDVKQYVEWTAPNHKLVLNGHSIGGSVAVLLLIIMAVDRGLDFVSDKVLRVYTFGSPPVMALSLSKSGKAGPKRSMTTSNEHACDVLDSIGLPSTIIYGFIQPWDPVVRLFTSIDALYPLIGDLGDDGVTPYATGPPRSLRPITKRIIEGWEGWPKFREAYRATGAQQYRSAGVQHILLAEPVRYVADRFIPLNIAVPPIEAFLRISSSELLPALKAVYPLDVFEISFVPQAIRSFVHHFYPAYGSPMMEYSTRLKVIQRTNKSNKADAAQVESVSAT
ncbi:hypothetical protein MPSEU_000629200 [Mayamaea pseudoterrestris]|nr:hypothetical protein MPSEU_000629200 [Mayamaea pseudoterrestris]